jgi:thiamine pyrophosphokinase
MRGVLLLNGQPYEGAIDDKDSVVYCCDGAYDWAKGRVRIDKNIGDFDSLPYMPDPLPEKIYPSEKDYTDGEIALFKMIEEGCDDIQIYGGGGGREDHFLGNLHLLYTAFLKNVKATMITSTSLMFMANGCVPLGQFFGKTISVLPFSCDVHIIDSAGMKYNYPQTLTFGECRGISNIVQSDSAFLHIAEDSSALIIVNRGKV